MPTWIKAILGIAVFSAVSLGIYIAISPSEEPENVAIATTAMPTPTTTELTTSTTTTLSPSTTTTVPPSTTTTTTMAPEEPKSFYWKGDAEKGGFAPLGVLTGPLIRFESVLWGLSGELRAIRRDTVDFGEGELDVWFVDFYFGDHPESGDEIIGTFFLGEDDWRIERPVIKGYWVPFDPAVPDDAKWGPGTVFPVSEFVNGDGKNDLVVGRMYPMAIKVDIVARPEDCDESEWCVFVFDHLLDFLPYNEKLVRTLRGLEDSPADGFGWYSSAIFLVPECPENICGSVTP